MSDDTMIVSAHDRDILRSLAARVAEVAAHPVMDERRRRWKQQSALQGERPLLLAETGGVIDQLIPVSELECDGEWARRVERHGLRERLFLAEQVGDDVVLEPHMSFGHVVHDSGYGVNAVQHRGDNGEAMGSYSWESPLKSLPDDLGKLHQRQLTYDREATLREQARLESVFGDILAVVNHSQYWWTQGMTWPAISLLGLEEFMLAMYDQPEGVHALMAFLRDDHLRTQDWFAAQGLLTLNNDDSYIGSGSLGYTDLLPQPDYCAGQPVRLKDLWVLSESQETVSVSPEMFAEFVFPYQLPVIERFGLCYYGCCEPVHTRWHVLKQIPNLRRVSISPWADEEKMAEYLGHDYVYCRKPNPALISAGWDENAIRADLRRTIDLTHGMSVEIVMKDVHTVNHEPWRLRRWVEIAREEIAKVYGE